MEDGGYGGTGSVDFCRKSHISGIVIWTGVEKIEVIPCLGDVGMGIGRSPCCHISTFKDLAHGPSSAVKVKQQSSPLDTGRFIVGSDSHHSLRQSLYGHGHEQGEGGSQDLYGLMDDVGRGPQPV